MTLSERTRTAKRSLCETLSKCGVSAKNGFLDALRSTDDEVLIFRRDTATGEYSMFTACCEAVLPPLPNL